MVTLQHLPLELLGYISQYCEKRDQYVLTSVSRAFNAETNRVLYSSVHISVLTAAIKFARTIIDRPDLAAFVGALEISLPSENLLDEQSIDLDKLIHLRHLNISALSHPSQFLSRLSDNQLISLHLSYAWLGLGSRDNLACFLARQRRLTSLTLDDYCTVGQNDLPHVQVLECPPLFAIAIGPDRLTRDLTILGTVEDSLIEDLLAALPSCLKSLDIILDNTCTRHLSAIARTCPNLETLKLKNVIEDHFNAIAPRNHLPQFPMLRTLYVQLYSDEDIDFDVLLPNCRKLYTNWKKVSPSLERLDVSFEDFLHEGTCVVDDINRDPVLKA